MHGHQGYLVVRVLLVLDIHVGQQGNILQERPQSENRIFNLGIILGLTFRQKVAEIAFPLLLNEMGDAVDEFLDIGSP